MNKKGSALIIARPNQLRASLKVLLKTVPQIDRIDLVDSGSAALALSSEYLPTLVLLDLSSFDYQTAATIKQLKTKWPHSRYVVLADNEQEEQLAISAKAEAVLIKGIPAAKLLATIEMLLSQ